MDLRNLSRTAFYSGGGAFVCNRESREVGCFEFKPSVNGASDRVWRVAELVSLLERHSLPA